MRKAVLLSFLSCIILAVSVNAAEMGRTTVTSGNVVKTYDTGTVDSNLGLEFDLSLSGVNWDIGSDSFDDRAWTPQFAASYGVSSELDIRLTVKVMNIEDTPTSTFSPDLNIIRWGVGSRKWFKVESDFQPYAGVLVNYYAIDADDGTLGSIDGAIGISGELGVAYQIEDFMMVKAGIQLEASVLAGKTQIGNDEEDISLVGLSGGVGLVIFL